MPDNPYAADFVRGWVKMKFGEEITLDEIRTTPVRRLRDRMIGFQEQFLEDGRLEKEVDALLLSHKGPDDLAKAVNERFGASWTAHDAESNSAAGNGRSDGAPQPTLKDRVMRVGRQFFRKELADLEQFVLIQIFDQSWKDHLYAMDMLRNGIGLQAFA